MQLNHEESRKYIYGDLIPCNMQSRHSPEEPQQLGSGLHSTYILKHRLLTANCFISAIPL